MRHSSICLLKVFHAGLDGDLQYVHLMLSFSLVISALALFILVVLTLIRLLNASMVGLKAS